MMSAEPEEGGAGGLVVCGGETETEAEPLGGATITIPPHTWDEDDQPHHHHPLEEGQQHQHHPGAEETSCCGERGGHHDQPHHHLWPLVTEQFGAASSECNMDNNNGEACCMSGEDGTIGESYWTFSSEESCIHTPSCRICFQGAKQGNLLNPCRCDGSVRHVHQHCLLKWISERGAWTCELCRYRFHVTSIHKRPGQWQAITVTLVEKVQIIAVCLGSLFLVASISWLLWSGLSPQPPQGSTLNVLFQVCYAMYGFMILVCIGLVVHEGLAVHNVFMRWRAANLHWEVLNYDKAAAGPLLPTQQGSLQPWSCLCFRPLSICCPPYLATRDSLSQNSGSGEVVVHATSV